MPRTLVLVIAGAVVLYAYALVLAVMRWRFLSTFGHLNLTVRR